MKRSFCIASEWVECGLHVYQAQSTTQNRRTFRQVARETCGESMEPPDDNLIMFGEISNLKGENFPFRLFFRYPESFNT